MNRKKYFRKEAEQFKIILREKEPYLDPGFTRDDLCKELNLSPMQFHSMVNRNFGMNYSKLMNKFRVEEAKKLLEKPDSREMKKASVAKMAGFGSLSQFNVHFKKMTGMTPTEYSIFYRRFKNLTGKSPDQFKKP
ncbi:MAG: AraC family transcriptional regulator [Balneolaceae bacterium]